MKGGWDRRIVDLRASVGNNSRRTREENQTLSCLVVLCDEARTAARSVSDRLQAALQQPTAHRRRGRVTDVDGEAMARMAHRLRQVATQAGEMRHTHQFPFNEMMEHLLEVFGGETTRYMRYFQELRDFTHDKRKARVVSSAAPAPTPPVPEFRDCPLEAIDCSDDDGGSDEGGTRTDEGSAVATSSEPPAPASAAASGTGGSQEPSIPELDRSLHGLRSVRASLRHTNSQLEKRNAVVKRNENLFQALWDCVDVVSKMCDECLRMYELRPGAFGQVERPPSPPPKPKPKPRRKEASLGD